MDSDYDPVDRYLETIDTTTLLPVVRRILASEAVEIDDWRPQPLDEGSVVGSVFRLAGRARVQTEKADWSMILKFVMSPSSGAGEFVALSDDPTSAWYWRRELLLYESTLISELPDGFTAPQCYRIDDQPNGYWLWLEDVKDHLHRNWPLEHYAIAARHIGRLSGKYLVDGAIPSFPWLTPRGQRMREAEKQMVQSDIWAQLLELRRKHPIVRRGWPDGLLDDFHRIWKEREIYFRR